MSSPLKIFEEEITKLRNSLGNAERRLSKLQEYPFKSANDLINDYLGKRVAIRLRSGEVLRGRYARFDKYHVLLETDAVPLLVFKHAIEMIHEEAA